MKVCDILNNQILILKVLRMFKITKETKKETQELLRELRMLENTYGRSYFMACINGFNGKYEQNLATFVDGYMCTYAHRDMVTPTPSLCKKGCELMAAAEIAQEKKLIELTKTIGCNV